jgi:hypothetical protein
MPRTGERPANRGTIASRITSASNRRLHAAADGHPSIIGFAGGQAIFHFEEREQNSPALSHPRQRRFVRRTRAWQCVLSRASPPRGCNPRANSRKRWSSESSGKGAICAKRDIARARARSLREPSMRASDGSTILKIDQSPLPLRRRGQVTDY